MVHLVMPPKFNQDRYNNFIQFYLYNNTESIVHKLWQYICHCNKVSVALLHCNF